MSKILYLLLLIISMTSVSVLYSTAIIINWINKYIIKYRINIIRKNINLCFPWMSENDRNKLIDNFYQHFFNIMVEIIKSISWNKDHIKSKVIIKNMAKIKSCINKKQNIVLLCAHYSNWELLLLRLSLIKNINLNAVYKPLSSSSLNKILLKIRTKFGAELVPLSKWRYFMLRKKNTPHTFMFVCDQVPNPKENSMRIDFLNKPTLFHKGPEKTAQLLNAKVFYIEMYKSNINNYIINFKPINSNNITEKYASYLESTIKKQPEYWLWSHNRWKR